MIIQINRESYQDLLNYLESHESDIHHGINDFGCLEDLFYDIFGRKAME